MKGTHSRLYKELKNSPDYNEQKLGNLLEQLFKKKHVDANYFTERDGIIIMKHISKKLADIHDNCEETLKLVAILKNNPPIHRF